MTLLEELEKQLAIAQKREDLSNAEVTDSLISKTNYYIDMGYTNGLIDAIEIVKMYERNK